MFVELLHTRADLQRGCRAEEGRFAIYLCAMNLPVKYPLTFFTDCYTIFRDHRYTDYETQCGKS